MRKLLGLLGLVDVVITKDFNGQVRYRFVRHSKWTGRLCVYGIGGFTSGDLEANGTISGHTYMRFWKPYKLREKTRKELLGE